MCASTLGCGSSQPPPTAPTEPDPVEATPPETPAPEVEPERVDPPAAGQPMFVHEEVVECQGEGPMTCLKVRESPDEEWTLFYDAIEGFEHEEGTRYELRVEVTDVENPPAGGSSKRYRLIEVVSQEKAEPADD